MVNLNTEEAWFGLNEYKGQVTELTGMGCKNTEDGLHKYRGWDEEINTEDG